jgi:peptidoglycan/LPS O-acetylase OafA/YrhL
MMRWRRPYSAGPFNVLVGCLITLGLALFLLALVSSPARREQSDRRS